MKKIISIILFMCFVLTGCTIEQNKEVIKDKTTAVSNIVTQQEIRSVWLTYYELQKIVTKSEKEFKDNISKVFENITDIGFNTLTVQVRPCADAFYNSKYFPISRYCKAQENDELLYDPLEIICELSKKFEINIEAWINPYRVSQDNKIDKLNKHSIAYKWYNKKETKDRVYITDNEIYFNPSSQEVEDLIVNGVKEIVKNYDIYAIHFDDYFYPTKKKDIDKNNYKKYVSDGGKLKLSDYRRDIINKMVKTVYAAVKDINKSVMFGISPASDIDNNYDTLYADVKTWVTQEGYVDYICPQIYFGFKNVYQPFMFTTKKWISLAENTKIFVGLPLYKCGQKDKYAAKNDKSIINEFKNNNDIIFRQITYLSKLDEISGFYIFSYSNLIDENNAAEVENMKKAMQNSSQE